MGAHATLRITRETAKRYMMERLFNVTDQQLEEFMDRELDERLYNCVIVGDDDDNDDAVL